MGENTPALPLLATEDVSKEALMPAPDLPPKQPKGERTSVPTEPAATAEPKKCTDD